MGNPDFRIQPAEPRQTGIIGFAAVGQPFPGDGQRTGNRDS